MRLAITTVRAKGGTAGEPFGALRADHPLVRDKNQCPVCGDYFRPGDITCLVPIGSDDADARSRAFNGHWYTAVALVVHNCCGIARHYIEAENGEPQRHKS